MDFTIFPPEFNSLNIQGSARPFLVAANAWKNLSNELSYAASRFESEINGLITSWRGPSSTIMAAAVAPFRAWIVTTASLAELVADHISVVAGAYEAAHAAHVPLPVIETNRLTRLALATTKHFRDSHPRDLCPRCTVCPVLVPRWRGDEPLRHNGGGRRTADTVLAPGADRQPGRAGQTL